MLQEGVYIIKITDDKTVRVAKFIKEIINNHRIYKS